MGITSYSIADQVRDVSPIFNVIKQIQTPLLNSINIGNKISATTHYWWDDVRKATSTTLGAAYTQSTASGVLTVASSADLKVNSLIQVAGQIKRVTVVTNSTTITTTHIGGSADADIANGTTVYFMANAEVEAKDFVDGSYTPRVQRSNVTQIYQDFIMFSGTQQAINNEAGVNDGTAEVVKTLERLRLGMARGFVNNTKVAPTDNATPRVAGGIMPFIVSNGYNPSAANPYASDATTELDNLDAFINELFLNRGFDGDMLWMNPTQRKWFTGLDKARLIHDYQNDSIGRTVSRYITKHGQELTLATDPSIPDKKLIPLNMGDIRVLPLRPFTTEPIAKSGDSTKVMVVGEYTIEFQNSAKTGIFTVS